MTEGNEFYGFLSSLSRGMEVWMKTSLISITFKFFKLRLGIFLLSAMRMNQNKYL